MYRNALYARLPPMNRGLMIAAAVLAVIALFVWFFNSPITAPQNDTASSSPDVAAATSSNNARVNTAPSAANKAGAITYKSLLTQSGSYECDYSQVQSTGRSENVIYLYGGRLRGEFRTISGNSATVNLLVYDGRYLYEWREGASNGTRTVLTSLSQLPLIIPRNLTSGSIYGSSYESVGWICHTWLTNKSLLMPPSYVTFG
jgi:hypothetical protein